VYAACVHEKIGGSFVKGIDQNVFSIFHWAINTLNEEPKSGGKLASHFDSRFGGI